jgi:hypothetical protein
MAIIDDGRPKAASRIVSFRAPDQLMTVIEREASKRLCSISDVARELVVCDLRRRGLMEDAK